MVSKSLRGWPTTAKVLLNDFTLWKYSETYSGSPFFQRAYLVMKLHDTSTWLRSEDALKSCPQLSGSYTTNNMRNHWFRERGDQGTQNKLISLTPGNKFWIHNRWRGSKCWSGIWNRLRWWNRWSIHEAKSILADKIWKKLSLPNKIVIFLEFDKIKSLHRNIAIGAVGTAEEDEGEEVVELELDMMKSRRESWQLWYQDKTRI
jgi:hypothetical protein